MGDDIKGAILLVDDDRDVLSSAREFFEEVGYVVYGFTDGHEAMTFIRERRTYDLLLTDLQLDQRSKHRINGPDLIQRSKRYFPDRPVIAYSGFGYECKLVDRFFLKPCSFRQVLSSIEELLARS